jgi:hypothetical protein
MQVIATRSMLTPFGECPDCRRFTIWAAVHANDLSSSRLPQQRRAS